MVKTKLGLVSFLNVAPLRYPLVKNRIEHNFEIVSNIPSTIAKWLDNNQIDIGLIPIFEYLRSKTHRIIPDVSISSTGPVKTVVLHHRCPLRDIKRVFLDRASRTSAALTKIILKLKYKANPEYKRYNPMLEFPDGPNDAALVIGDRGFLPPPPGYQTLDLGREWKEFTNLPFVYAVFAVRDGFQINKEGEALRKAKEFGLANMTEIAQWEAQRSHIDEAACRFYLEKNIDFNLSNEHIKGVKEFINAARDINILNGQPELRFI